MKSKNYPLYITTIYLIISILWIALSDQAVLLFPDTIHTPLQTTKGWLFVCATSLLIYSLIKKEQLATSSVIQNLHSSKKEVDTLYSKNTSMLEALPVAIIQVDFSRIKVHLDQVMMSHEGKLADWFKASPQNMHSLLDLIEIKSVEGAACELFQVKSSKDLISRFKTTFTATSIDNIKEDIICFYQGQNSVKNETEFARSDGTVFEASTLVRIAEGTEKPWQRLVVVIEDITVQRQAEEQLRRAASIIENTSEGAIVTDLNGRIIDTNPAFTVITGYERSEVIGKKPSVLSSGKHDHKFYQRMWKALEENGLWQGEIWNRKRNGEIYPEYLTVNRLTNNEGHFQGYVGVFTDISALKKSEDTILKLSTQDPLTGLPNANAFTDHLHHAIEQCARNNHQFGVLSLDIDNFKLINESLGFEAGDELLNEISSRLQHSIRAEGTISRFGGDEFKLLVANSQNPSVIPQTIETIQEAFKAPFQHGEQLIHLTASIGISQYPTDGQSKEELVRNADTALSQAKQIGSNQYKYYSKELTEAALESIFIENALRVAIEQEQLILLYQPQFDLKTQQLIGMEALIRWKHPEIGIVSPMKFIPVAERTGMIQEIGQWVIESACQQGRAWLDAGYDFGRIAVNVSGAQLMHGDLANVVNKTLETTGFDPNKLELEVTESFIMQNAELASEALNKLRNQGIKTAIDDFGTGYSSLSYLKKLPIDKLKIDRSFVSELPGNADGFAIINAIISLGEALNLTLIAEGVEITAQEKVLSELGCHQVQGYLYSKPVAGELMESTYLKS